jgi:phosphoenolpyruvate carboxykinase (ATP)
MNPTVEELYEDAIKYFDCKIASNGSLVALSGDKTGRSAKDKRIVRNIKSKNIWWGNVNIPISTDLYNIYRDHAISYLKDPINKVYIIDSYAGWDLDNQLKIRIYCYHPYHALFMKNMLIEADQRFEENDVDFNIYNVGHLKLSNVKVNDETLIDDTLKDTLIGLDLAQNNMVIYGSEYAGEMKKGVLTLMMYKMPLKGHLPLHSSANVDENCNVSLFFGLSGSGKTTLSSDSKRYLIGDDEHVWTSSGIFNIEGGCYAKCVNLEEEKEPDIFHAIRYGSVCENVIMNERRVIDYTNISITENTRCSYSLEYIDKVKIPAIAGHPNHIILLTCDVSGILPPVALLDNDQASFMFICGYTAIIGGTTMETKETIPVFSACFGEPFLIWSPKRYGDLLKHKLKEHPETKVWMVNTGWSGEYEKGHRISIKHTRAIIDAIHSSDSEDIGDYKIFPYFNMSIPQRCKNVPSEILDPMNSWDDEEKYMTKLKNLYDKFNENYDKKCK